jgi:L-asparaginase
MSTRSSRPRVAIIGTGGTIQSVGAHSLDLHNYGRSGPMMEIEHLIESVPEVSQIADVTTATLRAGPSPAITSRDWLKLNDLVHQIAEEQAPVDGIVITHGTASLEETAFFLNLTLKVEVPVVFAASQRPFSALSTDAGLNLVNAVRTAASPEARGLGVLVMLNDEIQPARDVTKGSTLRLETFQSRDLGMLGYADPDGIVIYRRPARRHAPDTEFDVRGLDSLPRVDVAYSYIDADGAAIDAFVAAGARGIVVAGFAPGGVTPDQDRALADAREQGILVVQSCRAGSGRVLDTERLKEKDIVAADNHNPQKARILAMLALTRSGDPKEFQRIAREY